jgi:serine/threonine protein kinase
MLTDKYFLKTGATLANEKYRLDKVLGVGPFAITYLAQHCLLNKSIIIKEFFIAGHCEREGQDVVCDQGIVDEFQLNKKVFIEEALLLAKFIGVSAIIDVIDQFEGNGTAYFVMPFIEGMKLDEYVKSTDGHGLKTEDAVNIIREIALGVMTLHKHEVLHKNLSPGNIIIDEEGSITIIDFDFSLNFNFSGPITESNEAVELEFRAIEQLSTNVKTSKATDIYSLGAIFYFLSTGQNPPSAISQLNEGRELELGKKIPSNIRKIIRKGMALKMTDRYQEVAEFVVELPKIKSKRSVVSAALVAAASLVLFASIYLFNSRKEADVSAVRGTTTVTPQNENVVKEGAYYGLIIGVEDYDNPDLSLDNPIDDAYKVKKALQDNYTFEEQNLILLENPTKQDIIQELYRLRDLLTEKDNLLIFYAGHGHWDERAQQGYWMPSDADHDDPTHWISNSTIKDKIRAMYAAHVLVISDACFSGAIFKFRSMEEPENKAIQELNDMKSRRAMTSGNMTEVPDLSVFADYLVVGLENNTSKYMTAGNFFQSFKENVINNSNVKGLVPQYGILNSTGDEGGDFIFVRK